MSFERIVDTARALVKAGGADSLSMRKLSAELGVAPTAIYWHVGDRAELLNAVLDAELADLPKVRAVGTTPHARLRSVARAIRRQVQQAPHVQALALTLDRSAAVSFPGQVALAREITKRNERAPTASLSIYEATDWIARLGGYNGKSSGGPPGSITLRRGLERLRMAVAGVRAVGALDD